ncbi:MAG TPA: oxalate/formate MFS antiporter [Vicinamibacterales bacterium]|nr:oxalate/formate MFS antiporter [Vicinamibacterales bacterium]
MTINSRWFQLCASLVAMIMIANLQYSWTLFVEPMRKATGWKLSDVQWAFTLFILFQTWVQPAQGFLIDRMGPRVFTTLAGVLCGIGWTGLGLVTTLPMLYTLYVIAGIGAALIYGGCMGSALKWFKKERGFAAGLMAAGFGGGTALFIPVIASVIKTSGYQTAFIYTGVFQAVVILVVAQFLRHPQPEAAPAKPSAGPSVIGQHQFTTGEMLRTRQFYVLYASFVMMATGGLLVTANAGSIAEAWGIPVTALAAATSLNALANGGSRIFWGWASDRIGRERAMGIAFALQAICLVLVLTIGRWSGTLFTITLVLTFFTWGEIFSLFPSIVADYYGAKCATANYGVMYSAKGVASIIGGWVAALLFERFGTWAACFYGSAVLALLAAVLITRMSAAAAASKTQVPVPATVK